MPVDARQCRLSPSGGLEFEITEIENMCIVTVEGEQPDQQIDQRDTSQDQLLSRTAPKRLIQKIPDRAFPAISCDGLGASLLQILSTHRLARERMVEA